jgi:hypothetical protein
MRIEGQLQNAVDVKRAKVGDEVLLKTTKAVKQNGQTVIPKGSMLLGRVTEVAKRSKGNSVSRLGMIFDRLQGRDLTVPISASIVSITNAAGRVQAAEFAESDLFGSTGTSASGSTRNGGGSGGLLGGVTGTVGGVLNTTTQTVGSTVNTATNTVGGATETIGRTAHGLTISNEASAGGSAQSASILSAAGRDIRLEKGATIGLRLNSVVDPI